MYKKLGVVAMGAALMMPLLAQAEGAYIGFNAGRANQKLTADDIGSLKDSSVGYKLSGGYDFNEYFGVQGGYVDLGKGKNAYSYLNQQGTLSSKVRSLYIAATASIPLGDDFSVFAKLGISRNRAKAENTYTSVFGTGYDSESATRTSRLIGVGAAYNISKNLSVLLEYEDFGKVAKGDDFNLKANLFSAGLRYKF